MIILGVVVVAAIVMLFSIATGIFYYYKTSSDEQEVETDGGDGNGGGGGDGGGGGGGDGNGNGGGGGGGGKDDKDDKEPTEQEVESDDDDDKDDKEERDMTPPAFDYDGDRIAFKGAMGAGSYTMGGNGGYIYHVTSLSDDDDKKGTLGHAIKEARRPAYVVFDVAGVIDLKGEDMKIREPRITIDGSTAPGKGITVKGFFYVRAGEVIIRYMRFRPGHVGNDKEDASDAFTIREGKNVIVDHCSCSWSSDEVLSVNPLSTATKDTIPDNVTVQYCFITEPFGHEDGGHRFGTIMSTWGNRKISYLFNLFAHCDSRNPRLSGKDGDTRLDFRNNLIYNWGSTPGYNGSTDSDSYLRANFVANMYVPGPDSKNDEIIYVEKGTRKNRMFVDKNCIESDCPSDNYDLVEFDSDVWDSSDIEDYKDTKEFDTVNTETVKAKDAMKMVLEKAGCTKPKRDKVDERIIKEVKDRKGRLVEDFSDSDYEIPDMK